VPPYLNRLQNRGGSAKNPFRDLGEALGRVSYIEMVQIVAELPYPILVWYCGTGEPSDIQQGLYLVCSSLSRVNQRNILANRFAYYTAQDRVVGATENKRAEVALSQVTQIVLSD